MARLSEMDPFVWKLYMIVVTNLFESDSKELKTGNLISWILKRIESFSFESQNLTLLGYFDQW